MFDLLIRKSREWRVNRWNIGFVEEGIENVLSSKKLHIHWMKHNYKGHWFADPFILEYDEKHIIVLVEEFSYKRKIGRLAKLTIDRKTYCCLSMKIILELPTHLSFPFIFRKEDSVYILPENSITNLWNVYKYNVRTDELILQHAACELPLTDATITNIDEKYYVLSTQIPCQNMDCLQVYAFDNDKMRVKEKMIEHRFENNIARNAGETFIVNGNLYRPAQDCNRRYGHGIVLQKFKICNKNEMVFENVCSFFPNSLRYNLGLHTFNIHNGLIVVDAQGYRFPFLGYLLNSVSKLVKSVKL